MLPDDGRSISQNVALLNILAHDLILVESFLSKNLLPFGHMYLIYFCQKFRNLSFQKIVDTLYVTLSHLPRLKKKQWEGGFRLVIMLINLLPFVNWLPKSWKAFWNWSYCLLKFKTLTLYYNSHFRFISILIVRNLTIRFFFLLLQVSSIVLLISL